MTKENRKAGKETSVSIIGAGRMGGALALALTAAGYSVEAVVARRLSRARRLSALMGSLTLPFSEKHLAALPPSDLLIIATPDDVIPSVALSLAKAQRHSPSHRIVLHTSGALSSQALSPLAGLGLSTGSLHPLVSISDSINGAAKLRGAYFCLEGERAALRFARRVVGDLGGRSFSVEPRNKALYHAAAVMASGNMTALFDIATEMLADCGLSRRRAREVLLPLVESAVANLALLEPARALTGTFARGDVSTVQKHLAAIRTQSSPAALAAYVLLGQRSLELAKQKKPTVATADQISTLLMSAKKRKHG